MTEPIPIDVLHAVVRRDFPSFAALVFETLNPGQSFDPNWVVDAIAWQLMRVHSGKVRRLIVNVPPRSLKSTIVSVAWCAWCLGHDPTKRIICASYSEELAVKFSNDTRRVMDADWFRRIFPSCRIDPRKNKETEFQTTWGGGRLAVSVGGTLTGRGGDILIIDDPLKAGDAMSVAARDRTNEWFFQTALSRLDDPARGQIVVVAQRLHQDDLCGRLMAAGDHWETLVIPAIADVSRRYDLPPRYGQRGPRRHTFRAGMLMSPERLDADHLEGLKRNMSDLDFAAQYLQAPLPPGGAMVKRAWLEQRYDELPDLSDGWQCVHSWDVATTTSDTSDYSVCTVWYFRRDTAYLAEVIRVRLDYPDLRRRAIELWRRDRPTAVLVEDAGTGGVLVQDLKAGHVAVIGLRPEGDKIVRLNRALPMIEAGSVKPPHSAPWLDTYLEELLAFPGTKHDDQVDSTTQALNWIRKNEMTFVPVVSPISDAAESYWLSADYSTGWP